MDDSVVARRRVKENQVLLSRKHNFIFIHIYKNAGTSISKSLSPFAVSRFQRECVHTLQRLRMPYPAGWDPTPWPGHATAAEIAADMGQDVFDSFYSFAFVRNPWDWQVSLYTYAVGNREHYQHEQMASFGSFERYIHWRCERGVRHQRDFVCADNGELLVDFVGRFENLENDFNTICHQIGITARLPRLNVSNTRDYREYYDQETRDMVGRAFAPDIERFGYDFEINTPPVPAGG